MKLPFIVRRVVGDSMNPDLTDGQMVYASGWKLPKKGAVVVVQFNDKEVIKRISRISNVSCDLVSDNPTGSGYKDVDLERITGVVL